MANVIINDTNLQNIGDAIRSKNGLSTKYLPSEMANAIRALEIGGDGKQVKNGTTKSPVINTGLNKIESFSLYADLMSSEGLIQTSYTEGDSKINAIVCNVYSVNKICGNLTTTGFKVHGGTFEWIGEGSNYLFMENATYKWTAIGE